MGVSKGKLFVPREDLARLLELPDGVEILALKAKEVSDGFEFLLVSQNETAFTKDVPLNQVITKSKNISRKTFKEVNEKVFNESVIVPLSDDGWFKATVVLDNKQIFEDIINRVVK